jgi:hypothetical protein
MPLILLATPEGAASRGRGDGGGMKDNRSVHLLARQPIDPDGPHPFTAAGNKEFNCLLWMPPSERRAGDIVLVDSTNFTTLFGGTDSLVNFWRNLALMK